MKRKIFLLMYVLYSIFVTALVIGSELPHCSGPIEHQNLSEAERKDILSLHNSLRTKVFRGEIKGLPRAKEMEDLEWDEKLEDECRRWLSYCPRPDKTPHPPKNWGKTPYGQNMAWGLLSFSDSILSWFNEYKNYVQGGADPLIPKEQKNLGLIGHFTAIVNAKSNKLGCYQVRGSSSVVDLGSITCCNYSPPGNIITLSTQGQISYLPAYDKVESHEEKPKSKVSEVVNNDHQSEGTFLTQAKFKTNTSSFEMKTMNSKNERIENKENKEKRKIQSSSFHKYLKESRQGVDKRRSFEKSGKIPILVKRPQGSFKDHKHFYYDSQNENLIPIDPKTQRPLDGIRIPSNVKFVPLKASKFFSFVDGFVIYKMITLHSSLESLFENEEEKSFENFFKKSKKAKGKRLSKFQKSSSALNLIQKYILNPKLLLI